MAGVYQTSLVLLGEGILAYATDGADPIIGKIFEGNTVVFGGIIDVSADIAFVFVHVIYS